MCTSAYVSFSTNSISIIAYFSSFSITVVSIRPNSFTKVDLNRVNLFMLLTYSL